MGQTCVADVVPTKKLGRKPKSTKDTGVTQTTLPKGKITKSASKEGHSGKKSETVSKHFPSSAPAPETALITGCDPIKDEPVVLESAIARRLDWTPPRAAASIHLSMGSSATKEVPSPAGAAGEQGEASGGEVFQNLADAYGRKADAAPQVGTVRSIASNQDILGKRKLVEMVTTSNNKQRTPEPSPTKSKAPKKKPRTITELATAAYRMPDESELGAKQDTLLGYLEPTNDPTAAASKGPKAKGKAPKRASKARPPKKKKEEAPKPVLLSPTSALRQVSNQDFVFGTASQLATEDDPELLRALHEAMKVSNHEDSGPFASPHPANRNLTIRARLGARLWAASARDDDGDLLDLEVLDLTGSSPFPLESILLSNPNAGDETTEPRSPTRASACIEIPSDDSFDLGDSLELAQQKLHLPSSEAGSAQISIHIEEPFPPHPDVAPALEAEFEPPPSNQEQHQLLLSQSSSPLRTQGEEPEAPPRPNFELYTDARLSKEVASYGFKAVKKRAAMVALLNQCWESQNKGALGSREAHASMSTSVANNPSVSSASDASQPLLAGKRVKGVVVTATGTEIEAPPAEKRPRGRPRKDTTTSPKKPSKKAKATTSLKPAAPAPTTPKRRKAPAKSIVEIADSDSEDPFPSSPSSSLDIGNDDVFSSPPAVDLSLTEDTTTPTEETSLIMASPTDQQVALFKAITQAVITAPQSSDPTNPSWHEKMLMYDPVILEDLTAWLNSGQLDRVGCDREVSPGEVKRWCESKSVCCLWRVNLRGKERKRF